MHTLLNKIKTLLGRCTHCAHALVALLVVLVGASIGQPILASIAIGSYYLGREQRDSEISLLKSFGGSVWKIWPKAFLKTFKRKDLLYPIAVILIFLGVVYSI